MLSRIQFGFVICFHTKGLANAPFGTSALGGCLATPIFNPGLPIDPASRFGFSESDVYGGLTGTVVAIPLALAFGVASGAGPVAGQYGAIFVAFFVALFGGSPAQVSRPTGPMTVVMAGLLVKVGTDIINWDYLRRLRQAPRAGVMIMLVVLALTVLVELIITVATGSVLASLLFVKRMAGLQAANIRAIIEPDELLNLSEQEREILSVARGRILLFHLAAPISFASARVLSNEVMVLDLCDVPLIDNSTGLTIEEIIERARHANQRVLVAGATGSVAVVLERLGVFRMLGSEARCDTRSQALRRAGAITNPAGS